MCFKGYNDLCTRWIRFVVVSAFDFKLRRKFKKFLIKRKKNHHQTFWIESIWKWIDYTRISRYLWKVCEKHSVTFVLVLLFPLHVIKLSSFTSDVQIKFTWNEHPNKIWNKNHVFVRLSIYTFFCSLPVIELNWYCSYQSSETRSDNFEKSNVQIVAIHPSTHWSELKYTEIWFLPYFCFFLLSRS